MHRPTRQCAVRGPSRRRDPADALARRAIAALSRALARATLLAFAVLAVLGALGQVRTAIAQPRAGGTEAAATGQPAQPTPAWAKGRIAAAESDRSIPDELRPQVVQAYRDALLALEAAQAHRHAAAEYRRAGERAAAQSRVQARLAEAPTERDGGQAQVEGITDRTSVEEIEKRLIKEQAALGALQKQRSELERQLAGEAARPQESRAELSQARAAAAQIEADLATPAAPDERSALADARRTLLAARRDEQLALVDRLEQEILSYGPRMQLLAAERDRVAADTERLVRRVEALDRLLFDRRSALAREAREAAQRALEEATQRYPALAPAAQRSVELGLRLEEVARRSRATAQEREREDRALAQLEREFDRLRPQVTGSGGPAAFGQALFVYRERLARLPSRAARRGAVLDAVSRLGFELHQVEDERHRLADLPSAAQAVMAASGLEGLAPGEREQAAQIAQAVVREQRELLDRLTVALQAELRTLSDLVATLETIDARTTEFRTAIDRKLLWTRTVPPVGWENLQQVPAALVGSLGPRAWRELGHGLAAAPWPAWWLAGAGAVAAAILLAARRRIVGRLERVGARSASSAGDGMRQTLEAAALTVLLAAPVPALSLLAGWLALSHAPDALPAGLAVGLLSVGTFWLWGGLARQVFRPGGLAEVHFGWRSDPARRAWTELRWTLPLAAALAFVAAAAGTGPVEDRLSLGRLAYALMGVVSAFAMHRVLRNPGGEASLHGQRLWYLVSVAVPVLFAMLPLAGYGFTALALGARVLTSYWFVGAVLLLQGLAGRFVALHVAQEAGRAGADASAAEHAETERSARFLVRGAADFAFVIGLWWIWASLLPALAGTTALQLWTKAAVVGGVAKDVPVTFADVFLAAMVAVLTVVSVRNIPGALRILMKSAVRSDPSLRVAFSTVAQYLIVGVGTFSALSILGADWSKLQWLVAALGVGLGFGLQEIVANFVCGLIILFERPVRPGDVVTVGDVTGTVTKISVRATHFTDFDRKSVVVPNKALITEKVTNWTLSDQVTRLVITVGVAYGTDPVEVERILVGVARSLPGVMAEPAPAAQLMRFGESSLDFEVRLFVNQLDARLSTTHDFHVAAERALRERGIEIPFPQRDLHLRGWPAGAVPGAARETGEARDGG
jgi:potassium efflux system protein